MNADFFIPTEGINAILPGGVVRFQVREDRLGNSSTWKVRTSKKFGDVYIIHRETGKWIKSSFHEEVGRSHYAVTSRGQKLSSPAGDPYLEISYDRKEIAPGWFHGKRIIIAKSELRPWAEPEVGSNIVSIGTKGDFSAISIDLILGGPGAEPLHLKPELGRNILGVFARSDGGSAILLNTPINLEYDIHDSLNTQIQEARDGIRNFGWDGSPTRIVIALVNEDTGTQKEIEVALDE